MKAIKLNTKNTKEMSMLISCFAVILFFLFAYLLAAFFVVPAGDDFTNALSFIGINNEVGFLSQAISQTIETYMNWQGTYTGVFYTYYMAWFVRGGYIALRLECFFVILLFFIVFYFLFKEVTRLFCAESFCLSVFFYVCFILWTFPKLAVDSTFYWHTGIGVYTIPLIFAACSIIVAMKWQRIEIGKGVFVFGCICAFLGAGGALQISAIQCAILLLFVCIHCINEKKIGFKRSDWIFLSAFVGSILNTVAPGNFVRKETSIDNEFGVIQALVDSALSVMKVIVSDFTNIYYLIIVVLILIVGGQLAKSNNLEYKHPFLFSVYIGCSLIIMDFPVKLGYGSWDYWPTRSRFIEKICIVVTLIAIILYWSGWLYRKNILIINKQSYGMITLILAVMLLANFNISEMKSSFPLKIYKEWVKGNLDNYRDESEYILEQIENSQIGDVYVDKTAPDTLGIYYGMCISPDKTYWVNDAVAKWYGVDSVWIKEPREQDKEK